MSTCSIKQCNSKRNQNQPLLTFHKFPENEYLRRKWIEAIGKGNIKDVKKLCLCSLHFRESNFNRTLGNVVLRENVVPSLHLPPSQEETENVPTAIDETALDEKVPIFEPVNTILQSLLKKENQPLNVKQSPEEDLPAAMHESAPRTSTQSTNYLLLVDKWRPDEKKLPKYEVLQKKCIAQKKKIRTLDQKIRRQNKRIINLKNIIAELKQKKTILVKNQELSLLKSCSTSEEFFKSQIAKSKVWLWRKNIGNKLENTD